MNPVQNPPTVSLPEQDELLWAHITELPYFRSITRTVEAGFFRAIELPAPVLDVGCGDGHFATAAFARPLDVGLDPWTGPIREAARRGGYRSLVQADGGQMPFPEAYFASAVSNSVLEHIPHIDTVLAETARVLQPGARFYFSVPNPAYLSELSVAGILGRIGLHSLGAAYTEWFRKISRVHHADPPEVWEARLRGAGFQLEQWWHYLPPPAWHQVEWGHYFGAPTLLPHALTGRWILVPGRWNLALTHRFARRYTRAEAHPEGTFTFFIARRKTL